MDQIIAESIHDGLAGDDTGLPEPTAHEPVARAKDEPDAEPKSERSTSGSDQFVMVSGGGSGSEAEVVDVRVEKAEAASSGEEAHSAPSESQPPQLVAHEHQSAATQLD